MTIRSVSQQHFFLYLICISTVAAFDIYNSIVRLKPDQQKTENEHLKSDKSNKKSKQTILGVLTFITGFLIRQIAIIQLGKFYTYKVSISDDHEMIDTGLYASMRHPAYTGTLLELTGAALLYNHFILSCFLSIPYSIVVLERIKQEEKVLIEEFGPKYQNYMKQAGMFLPKFN